MASAPLRNGNLATAAIEKRSVFDDQTFRRHIASYFCGTAENNFPRVDLTFDGPIYFSHGDVDDCLADDCAGAHDQRAVRRNHLSRKVSVDSQRGPKGYFTRKLNDITNETQPIVLWNIDALVSLPGCRNCLSAHCVVPLCWFLIDLAATLRRALGGMQSER
jgi:hypothetical protein